MNRSLLRLSESRAIEAQYLNVAPPLMERAGLAAANYAATIAAPGTRILLCAGPGNNGGDAFVTARLLKLRGHDVSVVFAGDPNKLPADAALALQNLVATGVETSHEIREGDFGLVVDGLFGIGLTRAIEGAYAALIERINAFAGPVLALDIPSGLDGDTGRILGIAVKASHTISFISGKPGLYTLDGPDQCGIVCIDSLGLNIQPLHGAQVDCKDFATLLTPRRQNSHKGSYGSLAVIGGAPGMAGAALLTARAALQLGAGRVFVGMLAPVSVDPKQPELMLRAPDDALDQATAGLIGPGLGLSEAALAITRRVASADFSLLLDADALNILAAHPVLQTAISRRKSPTVLTPHPTEAARLLACSTADIQADRIASALRIATQFKAVVALKGCGTALAHPDGRWRINTTGNAGLATAGSGDVLSGLIGALLAQHWPAWEALCAAVHLHGCAADQLVERSIGPIGITAGELIPAAREAFNCWIAKRQAH
jgi:hydroxyethylthiazole kinase-like uncharacterized protein yjeF